MEQTLEQKPAIVKAEKPKIISVDDLIKSTWSDFSHNWQKFAYLLIIPLVVSYLISLSSYLFKNFGNSFFGSWQLAFIFFIIFIIITVAFAILYLLTFIAEFLLLRDLSQEVSFNNLLDWYKKAKPYFWLTAGVSIVFTILAFLCFVLLIIPGIVFCVFYSFAIYAVLFEESKFEGAFGRSRDLVRGYFWPVFGRFMIGIMIAYFGYIVIGGIYSGIIWLISLALQLPSSKELFTLMYDLLSVFIGLAVGPLSLIYTYKIYQSLKSIKDDQLSL